MPTFRDANQREWLVSFDGLLLGEVRDECKVDLCDPGAEGYLRLQMDDALLVQVLTALLRESIAAAKLTGRDFSKAIRGQSIEDAFAAIWSAAENFFPAKKWSAMQSAFQALCRNQEAWDELRPMMRLLNNPDMPDSMREAVLEAIGKEIGKMAPTDSAPSTGETSATNSTGAMASPPASTSPESPESVPAA